VKILNRRWLAIAAVVAVAGFGAACGDDNNNVTGSNQVSASPSPSPSASPNTGNNGNNCDINGGNPGSGTSPCTGNNGNNGNNCDVNGGNPGSGTSPCTGNNSGNNSGNSGNGPGQLVGAHQYFGQIESVGRGNDSFFINGVRVTFDENTRFVAGNGRGELTNSAFGVGDFVTVWGYRQGNGDFLAYKVRMENSGR